MKVGGLASVQVSGVPNALFFHTLNNNGSALRQKGTVGIALSGNIEVEAIVAQGCRPIGHPFRVSQGERNIILELAELEGESSPSPPLVMLRQVIQTLNHKRSRVGAELIIYWGCQK